MPKFGYHILRVNPMTKGQKRELSFRNAMMRDLYQFRDQGIITQQTFEMALNSISYTYFRRT